MCYLIISNIATIKALRALRLLLNYNGFYGIYSVYFKLAHAFKIQNYIKNLPLISLVRVKDVKETKFRVTSAQYETKKLFFVPFEKEMD